MEKRQNEDSDPIEQPLATAAAYAGDESGRENETVQDAEAAGGTTAGEGGQPEDNTDTDAADTADTTDPAPDPEPDAPGTADEPGSGDDSEGDPGTDGDRDGNGEKGAGERFLNSGAAASIEAPPEEKRERLAVSLLRMALMLLTGDMPEEKFVPLMDAVLAHEAVEAARAEGEIAGRNAVIEERLVTPPVGAPDLGGAPIARSRRAAASIFDLADMAR